MNTRRPEGDRKDRMGRQVRYRAGTEASDHKRFPTKPNEFSSPRPFKIGEVHPEEYEDNLESSGSIEDWIKQLEFLEKAKIRIFITGTVVSLWTSFAIVCIIKFALTGDALPLVTPALLSGPLYIILRFYYGRSPPGG